MNVTCWLGAKEDDMVVCEGTRGVVRDTREFELKVEFPGGRKVWVPRERAFKVIHLEASEWTPGQVPDDDSFETGSVKWLASDRVIF